MMYLYLQTGNRVRILLADSLQFYFALKESYHGSSVEQPASIDDDVQREKDSVDKYQEGVNTPFTCQNVITSCQISSNLLF